jgi:hypothetical protein
MDIICSEPSESAIDRQLVSDTAPNVESYSGRQVLMDRTIDLLIEMAKAKEMWPDVFEQGLKVLKSLPLAAGEFLLAKRRLHIALNYAFVREFGAAAFELRLLRSQLAA